MNARQTSAACRIWADRHVIASTTLFFVLSTAGAQALRDPTLPPLQIAPERMAATRKSLSIDTGPLTIIIRDGRNYVALGTRLYAQGQILGDTRIERITETEVWFLEDGVIHKISKFQGIKRGNVAETSKIFTCVPYVSKSSSAVPCTKTQP